MIKRYCKNRVSTDDMEIREFEVITFVQDDKGITYPVVVKDECDMSIYGEYTDWSLETMVKSGINPASFSSPTLSQSRLEASQKIGSIDLSALDTPTTE